VIRRLDEEVGRQVVGRDRGGAGSDAEGPGGARDGDDGGRGAWAGGGQRDGRAEPLGRPAEEGLEGERGKVEAGDPHALRSTLLV
jgi:hypothetical protein